MKTRLFLLVSFLFLVLFALNSVASAQNSPPIANPGPNQAVAVGATVQLSAIGSSDADGDPLTYSWSIISAPPGSAAALSNPNTVNPTFVADLPGSYVVQLIVNDGLVNSAPATMTVSAQGAAPGAAIPTLSEWGMMLLIAGLVLFSLYHLKKTPMAT